MFIYLLINSLPGKAYIRVFNAPNKLIVNPLKNDSLLLFNGNFIQSIVNSALVIPKHTWVFVSKNNRIPDGNFSVCP